MIKQEIETNKERGFTEEKIRTLEGMSISPYEKVELFLIKTGLRTATDIELTSDTWRKQEEQEPKQVDRNELENLEQSLRKLEYAFKVSGPKIEKLIVVEKDIPEEEIKPNDEIPEEREKIIISVAKSNRDLDEYLEAVESNSDEKLGRMYGFPESAIEAYSKSKDDESGLIARKDLPEEIRRQDWSLFAAFKMSKDNWEKELKTVKKWARVINRISPKIYKEYVEYMGRVENY